MNVKPFQLFDSHVHLDRLPEPQFLDDSLSQARGQGICGWLLPGVRSHDWQALFALAEDHENVWVAPGLHPMVADRWGLHAQRNLDLLLAHDKALAVGEIGLDAMVNVPLAVQEKVFREQLELAAQHRKPVLIHCRRAWGQVMDILREKKLAAGGILHAFGGSLETARQGLELGFVVSFGGPLTYPNARKRVEVLQGLPPEAVVLETDAPDLAPFPHQQQNNRPEWLPLIAQRVADLRGWSLAETARITTANACRILDLTLPDKGRENTFE